MIIKQLYLINPSCFGAGGRRFESCHLDIHLESLFYRGFFVCRLTLLKGGGNEFWYI